jgi:[acyl-carrier-protein] S-malonyltransferase
MKIAMVFPGQGSQSVGMMKAYAGLPEVDAVLAEAMEALGADFVRVLDDGPVEALGLTVNTQPAMLTAGVAAFRAWRALGGPAPEVVAGHSLGEYAALVAAGAIAFRDALPLVRFRAQAMQEAVPEGKGAMAAILNLEDDAVRSACAEAAQGEVVQAVNFNAPGQVVIAGDKAAVARAIEACKAKGAKRALPLPVSAPFHSSLMTPAAEKLKGQVDKARIVTPELALINNVDVKIERDPAAIRAALVRQAASPVRWVEIIRAMAQMGVTHVIECGPGKVLAGLTRRIDAGLQSLALSDRAALEQALAAITGGGNAGG